MNKNLEMEFYTKNIQSAFVFAWVIYVNAEFTFEHFDFKVYLKIFLKCWNNCLSISVVYS